MANYIFDKLNPLQSCITAEQVINFNKLRLNLINFYKKLDPELKFWDLVNTVEIENLKFGWGTQYNTKNRMAFMYRKKENKKKGVRYYCPGCKKY